MFLIFNLYLTYHTLRQMAPSKGISLGTITYGGLDQKYCNSAGPIQTFQLNENDDAYFVLNVDKSVLSFDFAVSTTLFLAFNMADLNQQKVELRFLTVVFHGCKCVPRNCQKYTKKPRQRTIGILDSMLFHALKLAIYQLSKLQQMVNN